MQCPCGSSVAYESCCEPYLKGERQPVTAEQLMRSRYTAFTKANMDYVFNTHDPRTRKKVDFRANQEWAENSEWLGLEIVRTEAGGASDETGMVEFVARYKSGGEEVEHRELSHFRKDQGHWVFVDGKDPNVQTFVREDDKVGRNDPCPCGSGKKFKKCCGA